MGDNLIMSNREIDRLKVIYNVIEGKLTWPQAADQLDLSTRQVGTLVARVRDHGNKGVIHGLRGKPSNHQLDPSLLSRALKAVERRYKGFGPTFANEKLRENEKIVISTFTLRRGMIQAGLWDPLPQKSTHRAWRERRSCLGELTQLDGSDHDWFEGRGPRCVLLIFIDDATSRILHGQFVTVEDAINLLKATRRYLERQGRPVAIYVDKDSIYKINRQATIEEQLRDSLPMTQFTRAMGELGIEMIFAHSPQAKGRVERGFKTHQDRLVKELRLRGISTIEAANRFLWDVYIPDHNRRCAVAPANPTNAHRPLLRSHNLDEILSLRTERTVFNDFTIRFKNRFFQLEKEQRVRVRPGHKVFFEIRLNGSFHIRFKDHYLAFKEIAKRPSTPTSARQGPSRSQPRPGTLEYAAKKIYVGPWAFKKGDVSTCPAAHSRL
jgi:hypothetical protein